MLLESLYFLFKGDTSDLNKKTHEAGANVNKLKNNLNSVDPIAKHLDKAFHRLFRSITSSLLALASVGAVLHAIKETADYTDQLDKASTALNVNIETLDMWGEAVASKGGTLQGFTQSLKSLQETFNLSSTNIIKSLPRIADLFQKIGTVKSERVGRKLGLDEGTILLLQQGSKGVDEILRKQKELGLITKQDAEITRKFNDQWFNVQHQFRTLFTLVGAAVLPGLTHILEGVQKVVFFLEGHKDLVVGALYAISSLITAFLIPSLVKAAIAMTALDWPFVLGAALAIALGAAFALAYEDIQVFIHGGNSLIGHFVRKWPILIPIAKKIQSVFHEMQEGVRKDLEILVRTFLWLEGFFNRFQKHGFKTGNGFTANLDLAQNQLTFAKTNPITAASSPNLISSTTGINNRATNVTVGDITINTQATDADGISKDFGITFNTYLRQAVSNYDDGVQI